MTLGVTLAARMFHSRILGSVRAILPSLPSVSGLWQVIERLPILSCSTYTWWLCLTLLPIPSSNKFPPCIHLQYPFISKFIPHMSFGLPQSGYFLVRSICLKNPYILAGFHCINIFFIHSSFVGNLGCYLFLVIINKAALKKCSFGMLEHILGIFIGVV